MHVPGNRSARELDAYVLPNDVRLVGDFLLGQAAKFHGPSESLAEAFSHFVILLKNFDLSVLEICIRSSNTDRKG